MMMISCFEALQVSGTALAPTKSSSGDNNNHHLKDAELEGILWIIESRGTSRESNSQLLAPQPNLLSYPAGWVHWHPGRFLFLSFPTNIGSCRERGEGFRRCKSTAER